MNSRDLLHFDAHFMNLLTEGQSLYFSDFGLAISSQFKLSGDEKIFFHGHHRYDEFYTNTHLVNWLVTTFFGAENRDPMLQASLKAKVQEI